MAAFIHRLHHNQHEMRRYLADRRVHPLNTYTNAELIQRYRFDREGILYITNLIYDDIAPRANRNFPIEPIDKICTALHFYATGCFQRTDGDTLCISQPSVSKIITQVTDALLTKLHQFVHLPNDVERRQNMDRFFGIANFPGIVGLIDGTHVRIQEPTENEDQFVNRKRYHSINVQIVVDASYRIINIDAQWPGSVHDSRILRQSGLGEILNNGDGHLFGDSGYPSRRWLVTPFLRPQTPAEERFNRAHKLTRSMVERAIGQLKRRFHCLHGELRVSPSKASRIIGCCCILHNIAKMLNIPDVEGEDEEVDFNQPPQDNAEQHGLGGQAYRQQIVNNHFTR
ncbi:putative nuclease HARBI1 [Lytechinus variegatus]|uniref:putative nuclease HARBI1 n=1 Tax=Lytechinus variegatus TaxID=7654 RepID=UPI001BB1FC22|nr:putative nuclease HARBI1 [Lytechinus variegatus]